jgi:hypothetical protein
MNFLIQISYFAASNAAMYSASIVESATVSCLELFQLTAPPFRQNTQIDSDRNLFPFGLEALVSVTIYTEFFLTTVYQEFILSASQVLKDILNR